MNQTALPTTASRGKQRAGDAAKVARATLSEGGAVASCNGNKRLRPAELETEARTWPWGESTKTC